MKYIVDIDVSRGINQWSSRTGYFGVVPFAIQVKVNVNHVSLPVNFCIWDELDDELSEDSITDDDKTGQSPEVSFVEDQRMGSTKKTRWRILGGFRRSDGHTKVNDPKSVLLGYTLDAEKYTSGQVTICEACRQGISIRIP